jgi:hypothetical protein
MSLSRVVVQSRGPTGVPKGPLKIPLFMNVVFRTVINEPVPEKLWEARWVGNEKLRRTSRPESLLS